MEQDALTQDDPTVGLASGMTNGSPVPGDQPVDLTRPEESKFLERPVFNPGVNLLRWKERIGDFRDDIEDWAVRRVRVVITGRTELMRPDEERPVLDAVRNAVGKQTLRLSGFWIAAYLWTRLLQTVGVASILAPFVIVFVRSKMGLWANVGTGFASLAILLLWGFASALLVILLPSSVGGTRSKEKVTLNPRVAALGPAMWNVLLAGVPVGVATLPSRMPNAPAWLVSGWFHEALVAMTWPLAVGAILGFLAAVALRLHWAWRIHTISRRLPQEYLIDRLTGLAAHLCGADEVSPADTLATRLEYIKVVEQTAYEFEHHWPRSLPSAHPRVQQVARARARHISATVRAEQMRLLVGDDLADVGRALMRVAILLTLARPFPEVPKDDVAYETVQWWRRLGRPTMAAVLFVATCLLVLMATWQPALPRLLESWDLVSVSTVARVPPDLRPAVLGAAVAVFSLFIKMVAPQPAPNVR